MAYVSERGGELYVKVRSGWRKVQVSLPFPPGLGPFPEGAALKGVFGCCSSWESWSLMELPPPHSRSADLENGTNH